MNLHKFLSKKKMKKFQTPLLKKTLIYEVNINKKKINPH